MNIPAGSYVLATKYQDGDPGDAWAVGLYRGPTGDGRHLVENPDGTLIYGPNGFRRVRAGLRADVGRWLLANADALERSPPGTVNLWTMLTDKAFEENGGASKPGHLKGQDHEASLRSTGLRATECCPACGGEGRDLRGHPNDPHPKDYGICPVCAGQRSIEVGD
jgi:hypothetical protein